MRRVVIGFISLCLLALGLFFIGCAGKSLYSTLILKYKGIEAVGDVVETSPVSDHSIFNFPSLGGQQINQLAIIFQDEQGEQQLFYSKDYDNQLKQFDSLPIIYNPDNTSLVLHDSFYSLWGGAIEYVLVALLSLWLARAVYQKKQQAYVRNIVIFRIRKSIRIVFLLSIFLLLSFWLYHNH